MKQNFKTRALFLKQLKTTEKNADALLWYDSDVLVSQVQPNVVILIQQDLLLT